MATGKSLNDMIAQIVLDLCGRTDLQANGSIAAAINDAIQIYQKERFRFNETQPLTPFLLFTNIDQYIYTGVDDARIPQLYKVDYINYLLGSTNNKMERDTPESIYL